MRAPFVASLVVACIVVCGCERVIGADFGAAQLATCNPAAPPGPPSVQNAGGSVEVVVATQTVDMSDGTEADGSPRWRTRGYDQDGVCTSSGGAPKCHGASWTAPLPPDGVDGIDDALGQLLDGQIPAFGQIVLHSSDVTSTIQSGAQPPLFLIQVLDYDGLADDDDVEARIYLTRTIGAPKWDGSDVFPLLEESFQGGAPIGDAGDADATSDASGDAGAPGAPRWSAHGYVSRYHLVVRFDAAALRILGVRLSLATATLGGTLSPIVGVMPQQWELHDAQLTGVLAEQEFLDAFPELSNAVLGVTVCTSDPNWANIKRFLCSYADIALGGGATCDGISYAIGFDTRRVQLGPVVSRAVVQRCAPDVDPANTTCATPP